LKQILAQNFKDASGLKAEGNDLMRSGRLTDAIRDLMVVVFHDFCWCDLVCIWVSRKACA